MGVVPRTDQFVRTIPDTVGSVTLFSQRGELASQTACVSPFYSQMQTPGAEHDDGSTASPIQESFLSLQSEGSVDNHVIAARKSVMIFLVNLGLMGSPQQVQAVSNIMMDLCLMGGTLQDR